jgi:hypothetical protein
LKVALKQVENLAQTETQDRDAQRLYRVACKQFRCIEVSRKGSADRHPHGIRSAFFCLARKSVDLRYALGPKIVSVAVVWLVSSDNSAFAADLQPCRPKPRCLIYVGGSIGIAASARTGSRMMPLAVAPGVGFIQPFQSAGRVHGRWKLFQRQSGRIQPHGCRPLGGRLRGGRLAPAFQETSGLTIGGISSLTSSLVSSRRSAKQC